MSGWRQSEQNMAASSILPTHQRFVNGVPVPASRKTLRLKEKYIILLVFLSFGIVCFGAFFFLPDLRDRVTQNVKEMRRQLQQPGQDIFLPQVRLGPDGYPVLNGKIIKHDADGSDDAHKLDDKLKLQEKVVADWENKKILDRLEMPADEHDVIRQDINKDKGVILDRNKEEAIRNREHIEIKAKEVHQDHEPGFGLTDAEPYDPDVKSKRDKVREVSIENLQDCIR